MAGTKRRQREAAQISKWCEEIMEQEDSGLSAAAWCKKYDKPHATFYYRRQRVLETLESILISRADSPRPVEFAALPSEVDKPEESAQNPDLMLHIRQDNLEIDIPVNTSHETIQAVIGALKC